MGGFYFKAPWDRGAVSISRFGARRKGRFTPDGKEQPPKMDITLFIFFWSFWLTALRLSPWNALEIFSIGRWSAICGLFDEFTAGVLSAFFIYLKGIIPFCENGLLIFTEGANCLFGRA